MYSGGHASLARAQRAFDEIAVRDVLVWNRILGIYIKHKRCEEALACAEAMRIEGVSPDVTTFVLSLKACGDVGSAAKGRELHSEVSRNGLLRRELGVGNSLVHMYAKLGSMRAAIRVFDLLPVRDAVSWNTLMSGYSAHGRGGLALRCFDRMHAEGVFPNAVSFVCAAKACGCVDAGGTMIQCRELHARIEHSGLIEREIDVGNALIRMYAEKARMAEARAVYERLPAPDAVSWNSLIGGYCELGRGDEVLRCLKEMRVAPDAVTYVYGLKACAETGAMAEGRDLHAEIQRKGLVASNRIVGNALVDMYAKCGLVGKAREALETLPARDAIAWNALVSGHVERGDGAAALACCDEMRHEGVAADGVTIVCGLRACGIEGELGKGIEIHAEVERRRKGSIGFGIGNALLDMYLRCCGSMTRGRELFDAMPARDIGSWSIVVAGCVRHGYGAEALDRWRRMRAEGIDPDGAACVSALRACGMLRDLGKGKEIHSEAETTTTARREEERWPRRNAIVACALIGMYAKCGSLARAREVWDKLETRDAASWNALLAAHAELGESADEALRCLEGMRREAALPDSVALACALKACARGRGAAVGREKEMPRRRLLVATAAAAAGNRFVAAALVDLHARAGSLASAQQALEKLPQAGGDAVPWNALIVGLVGRGCHREALLHIEQMQARGVAPDAATYVAGLGACRGAGCLERGLGLHAEIARKGLLSSSSSSSIAGDDLALGNALVDMYSRCGCLASASRVFDALPAKDAVSWNALMAGYARAADASCLSFSFALFDDMLASRVEPDPISFVVILNACSRALLARRARACFDSMKTTSLGLEHYACFADLLGRSGELAGALRLVTARLVPAASAHGLLPVWRSLLSACERSGNARVAADAFAHALLIPDSGGPAL